MITLPANHHSMKFAVIFKIDFKTEGDFPNHVNKLRFPFKFHISLSNEENIISMFSLSRTRSDQGEHS